MSSIAAGGGLFERAFDLTVDRETPVAGLMQHLLEAQLLQNFAAEPLTTFIPESEYAGLDQVHGHQIHANAPLAQLIGYASDLAELTCGTAQLLMWLNHYHPIKNPPPDADAA